MFRCRRLVHSGARHLNREGALAGVGGQRKSAEESVLTDFTSPALLPHNSGLSVSWLAGWLAERPRSRGA